MSLSHSRGVQSGGKKATPNELFLSGYFFWSAPRVQLGMFFNGLLLLVFVCLFSLPFLFHIFIMLHFIRGRERAARDQTERTMRDRNGDDAQWHNTLHTITADWSLLKWGPRALITNKQNRSIRTHTPTPRRCLRLPIVKIRRKIKKSFAKTAIAGEMMCQPSAGPRDPKCARAR